MITGMFVLIYTNSCCIKIPDKSYFILIKPVNSFLIAPLTLTISFELLDKDISPGGLVVERLTGEAGV